MAQSMAKTLTGMGNCVEKYAFASRDVEKSKLFAKTHGFSKAYGSYEELVQDKKVELIYIASPHSHHYEHIKLCLEHGKHVLCEKPFTVNASQAREVFSLAKEKKLLLTEAIWPRYQPFIKELQKTIASGIIGEVTTVTANLFYSIDMNQRIHDINLAGGALLDVGIYAINFALMCLGNDVEKVTAVCQKFESEVDKQSAVILNYADGKMAVTCSGTQAISDRKGIISGRKGHIIVENINSPESFSVYDSQRKLISEHKAPQSITGYEYEVLASMEAIKKGTLKCADCSHAQSIKLLEIMNEARAQMGIKYPFE